MRPSRTATLFVSVFFLAAAFTGKAQTGNQGSIDGLAQDPSGAVIPGVQISVRHLETGASFGTLTNEDGLFRFPVLPVGRYRLQAERTGFDTHFLDIELSVGARISVPLSFRVAAQAEKVVVQDETPPVETSRSQLSAVVDNRSLANLPVNGRDFTSFTLLLPGVTTDARGGLSFGGQRAMNSLLVDGAHSNDSYWGQPVGGEGFPVLPGQSGYHLSLETVQEFQANLNAYSAELGRAGGGVVNVITKSGTNEFHGSTFEFYRDKALNATNTINKQRGLPEDPFHFHEFGGVLGGPLVPKRLCFLAGYDGIRSNVANGVFLNLPPGFQLSADPEVAKFQQTALDYLKARADPWSFPFRQDDYLVKLDWQAKRGQIFTARWNRQLLDAPLSGPSQESREHATLVSGLTDIVNSSWTTTPSTGLVNVARFAVVASDSPWKPIAFTPEANVFEQGVGGPVLTIGRHTGRPQEISERRVQWTDTLSWSRGRHFFKFGAEVLLGRVTYFNAQNFTGSYRFLSLASFGESLAGLSHPRPQEFFRQAFSGFGTPGVTTHPNTNEYAGFVQDEWRVLPKVTLNAGLRYDLQLMGKPPVKNPSPELAAAGLDTSFRPVDPFNLVPRFGLAWSPLQSDRLVVRLGYGIFYAPTPSVLAARAHFLNGLSVQPRMFSFGTPAADLIPAYPNTVCGAPDPSGVPPSCYPPNVGASAPLLMFFSPAYQEPYTQQGSFGIEFAPRADLSASFSYLFVKGTHLQWVRDVNLATPTMPQAIGVANTTTRLRYEKYTRPRPLEDFDRISLFDSSGNSVFHGLAVQLNKRFSHDFQFMLSYTLSKTIDDNPNVYAINPGNGDSQLLSDPLNGRADRSASVNDQRHRFVLSGLWQLNYAKRLPPAARALLAGWGISGILTAQSGQPYSGLLDSDLNNDGNFAADRTPGLGRNTFYMPRQAALDVRLAREVFLEKRVKLLLIWEGFNALNRGNITDVNRTQYTVLGPTSSLACGIAGAPCLFPLSTGPTAFGAPKVAAAPRIMQLALKLVF